MKKSGFSLLEIVIAISLAVTIFIPAMNMFSTAGQAVYKTRNFSFANSVARRISQRLMVMPFEDIEEVPLPGVALCDAPDGSFFGPFFNNTASSAGLRRITQVDMPEFYDYLERYNFRYSLSVSNVSFGDGDEIKSVGILITWNETDKAMMSRLYVYVPTL
ncbi:MAG: hypothetical protein KKB51_08595 [Candidatus Riflebacteria bacterium]|nr:hypothetical protein [Candidatus Riflebacteria bacterium]